MNYTVDIIDTTDDTHVTIYEYAQKSSILLNWNGGDSKDDQNIVGSSLDFTLEVNVDGGIDAQFRHLFTGSETKYKVQLYKTDTPEEIIWTGFLLPDSYSEPYTNGTFYPSFTANDGLGRLKGKYLAHEFYEVEYSVVTYFAEILKLTNLEMPIYLAPAILNNSGKRYDEIYVSGLEFVKSTGEYETAYEILTQLLESMLCVVYQADSRWYIEGFNQRHLKVPVYYVYDFEGVYEDYNKVNRLIKPFEGLATPTITTVAPYNTVTVSHERVQQALPDTIAVESNDGWYIGEAVEGAIFPTHWYANSSFYPIASAPDYKVQLLTEYLSELDYTKYISLLKKIAVKQYDKFNFKGEFSATVSPELDDDTFVYNNNCIQILLNDEVIYTVTKQFEDTSIEFEFDIYCKDAGLLDVRIIQPVFLGSIDNDTHSKYISIESLELSVISFVEDEIITNTIDEDFSVNKPIELDFSDDATGFSKAFRLEKLDDVDETIYEDFEIAITHKFTQNGNFYNQVSLYNANLIADNIDAVYGKSLVSENEWELLPDLSVIYNYQDGEQMVVQSTTYLTADTLKVRRYKIKDVTEDRADWEKWTDAVYPVERDRYADSVGKVYRRLFITAHERVEFTQDNAVKFNDLVSFDYYIASNYLITNVSWDIDAGQTALVMVKAIYQNEVIEVGTENIPPIVDAGDDLIVTAEVRSRVSGVGYGGRLDAVAYDPDGFIANISWEILSGDITIGATDVLDPVVVLYSQEAELQITVTDSDGATASDTIIIYREVDVDLVLTQTTNFQSGISLVDVYKLTVSPELVDDYSLKIKGMVTLSAFKESSYSTLIHSYTPSGSVGITRTITFFSKRTVTAVFNISKNGTVVVNKVVSTTATDYSEDLNFEFNYIAGDDIEIQLSSYAVIEYSIVNGDEDYYSEEEIQEILKPTDFQTHNMEIFSVQFQQGTGVVNEVPVTKTLTW